jgi:hypothetical protein
LNGGANAAVLEGRREILVGEGREDEAAGVESFGEDCFAAEGENGDLFAESDSLDGEGACGFSAFEEGMDRLDHLEGGTDEAGDGNAFAAAGEGDGAILIEGAEAAVGVGGYREDAVAVADVRRF